jgi:hypothetical protein
MKTCLLQHLWRLNRSFRCEIFSKYLLLDFIEFNLFQSGYSIDLLREKKKPPPRRQNLDGFEPTTPAVLPFRSRPFYRKKRGIIIIIIVLIALLAVIVGAVVGSKKKKKKNGGKITSSTPTPSTPNQSISPATSTNLTSRTFTWTITRPGVPTATTTAVFPPGIEFTLA